MHPMDTLPSLFVSHGSPMIALEPGAAGAFLQRLGPAIDAVFGRPRAVLAVSAHTTARTPLLLAAARHDTVHDFGGFPDALYALRYDAPGAPALADEVKTLLGRAAIAATRLDQGGLDHGIWTVLRYLYPDADVPVLPLALVPNLPPAQQFALGEALAGLRRAGVLVLGSGSITHNLRLVFAQRPDDATGKQAADAAASAEMPESRAFRDWMAGMSAARNWNALFDYRRLAPHAALMHPTDEHLLPWYPATGAGGREATPLRLYDGVTLGCLGTDSYAFGTGASALQAALG
jgi:4,5-DOPA dioxygenase extradiol